MNMRVVLYARVSSERQVEKDLSIAAQLKALHKYAVDRGWEVVREFVDEAESARSANRPAFKEMIALAKQRSKAFDAILVWKLSRFARNREDSIIYKSLLKRHGVSVISINEQTDESPSGKLLEGMIEVIDEFYSTNLAQDTLRGMKENAGRGFHNGGIAPAGYESIKIKAGMNEKTKLKTDEVMAPIVQRIFQLCAEGMGAKEIVKRLNAEGLKTKRGKPWSKTNVYSILKNETYTGTLIWNRQSKSLGKPKPKQPEEIVRVENNHPALVDRKTFDLVQGLLKERSPAMIHPRRLNSDYLLSGFLYCGKCGTAMIGAAAKSSQFFYYACQNYSKRGKDVCDAKLVNKSRLEMFVIYRLKSHILTEENLIEFVEMTNEKLNLLKGEHEERLSVFDGQLDDLKERLQRLYESLETGKLAVEDIAPRIKTLRAEIELTEGKRVELFEKLQEEKVEVPDPADMKSLVEDLRSFLETGTILERKNFLRTLIKRIEVNTETLTIEYTIPLETKSRDPLPPPVLPTGRSGSGG